jgi:hypothetical protein
MIAVQRARKEAALPQVATAAVAAVEALGVVGLGALERQSQGVGVLGYDNQVNMVGHQTVTQHAQAIALLVLGQSGQVETPVIVDKENVLAIVASLRDVVRDARRHHAGLSGHGREIL